MNGEKKWYQSKGVWGSIIVVLVMLLRMFGHEETAGQIEAESEGITQWALEVVGLVAGLLAFWGRITADSKIGGGSND